MECWLLLSAPAATQEGPPKELDTLRAMLGKWACDAKTTGAGGHAFKAGFELVTEFDGHTFVERYWEEKSPDHPQAFKAIFLWTYDPATQRYVRNGLDHLGRRNSASATGWHGDSWVWDREGLRVPLLCRPSNGIDFTTDIQKDGQWLTVVEASCKKL